MKVKELIALLQTDTVNQEADVFHSNVNKTFQDRGLQMIGNVENLKNYVVLTPGSKFNCQH